MKERIKALRNKKGFTLVELIIVIVIIAILASIAIPSMIAYIKKANIAAAESNCRAVYSAAGSAVSAALAQDKTLSAAYTRNSTGTWAGTGGTGDTLYIADLQTLLGANFPGHQIIINITGTSVTSVDWFKNATDHIVFNGETFTGHGQLGT